MKKKIAFLLAITMLVSALAGCGSNKNSPSESSNTSAATSSESSTSEDKNSSASASSGSSSAPADGSASSTGTQSTPAAQPETPPAQQQPQTPAPEQPAKPQNPAPEQPAKPQQPTEQPKPETPAKAPAVSDVAAAVDKAMGVDDSFMSLSESDVSTSYGISSSSMEGFVGKMPMMNVKATEYLVVKAVDGEVENVKNGMLKRQADLDATWKQYLPEQYEFVKNYKLVTNGNYVLFAVGENAAAAVDAFNAMTK